MTEEEIKDYLKTTNNVDLVLDDTDSKKSFVSNYLIINRNFTRLKLRFNLMTQVIRYIYSLIDIENIIQQVLDKLAQTKTVIKIPVTLGVNQTINDGTYKITRDIDSVVTIERMLNTDKWITDSYIAQVKTSSGQVVYPVITTLENKIKIYFIDKISSDYNLYLI